jgi:hypothetical protein
MNDNIEAATVSPFLPGNGRLFLFHFINSYFGKNVLRINQ